MQVLEHYMWFEEHLDISLNRVMSGSYSSNQSSEAKLQKPLSLIVVPNILVRIGNTVYMETLVVTVLSILLSQERNAALLFSSNW